MIQQAIKKIVEKNDMSFEEAYQAIEEIMSGSIPPATIAALLIGLRMKGESVEEIAGAASAMKKAATPVKHSHASVIDTCGTGGDSSGTFNVSTVAAFIVAGAGYPVAKHGNKSVSSRCGSADVLQTLGVNIMINAEIMGRCLDAIGITFIFAPTVHGAMKHVMPVRKELGVRTIFNILGPLTNPATVTAQLMGVYDASLVMPIARVMQRLGIRHAMVVHGDGLDEIAITGKTVVCIVNENNIQQTTFEPDDFGFKKTTLNVLTGGTPQENAVIIRDVLSGKQDKRRELSVMNAAAGILLASRDCGDGRVKNLIDAVRIAEQSIDSGSAQKKLDELIRFTCQK